MKAPSLSSLLITATAVVLTITAAVFSYNYQKSRAMPFIGENAPKPVASTLYMRPVKSGEDWRILRRNAYGQKSELRIAQRAGEIIQVQFDDEGNPKIVNDYLSPRGDKAGSFNSMTDPLEGLQRTRRSEVGLGYVILAEQTYRADMSVKTSARRNSYGDLEVTTYRDNERNIEKLEVFESRSGTLKRAVYYREDGSTASTVGTDDYDDNGYRRRIQVQENLSPDGTLESRSYFLSPYTVRTLVYGEDGKLALRAYTRSYGRVSVGELDPDTGKVTIERSYATTTDETTSIEVTINRADGAVITQSWTRPQVFRNVQGTRPPPVDKRILNDGFFLSSARIKYPKDGKDGKDSKGGKIESYSLFFYYGTRQVSMARTQIKDFGLTARQYRPDGSLDSTEWIKFVGAYARGHEKLPPGPNKKREPLVDRDLTAAVPLPPRPPAELSQLLRLPTRTLQYQLQLPGSEKSK